MPRLAACVSYLGGAYAGTQKVHDRLSVAGLLEHAFGHIANHPVQLGLAGRTDKGVHALQQVVHFDTHSHRHDTMWQKGANTLLPQDVRVHWVRQVKPDFHSRHCAVFRRYCYLLETGGQAPAGLTRLCYSPRGRLDVAAMQAACQPIHGEYNCAALRGSKCRAHSSRRHIDWLRVHTRPPWLVVDIQANAFLYRMVRIVVAELLSIGRGIYPPQHLAALFALGQPRQRKHAAPARGLFLSQVGYAPHWQLPVVAAEQQWVLRLVRED